MGSPRASAASCFSKKSDDLYALAAPWGAATGGSPRRQSSKITAARFSERGHHKHDHIFPNAATRPAASDLCHTAPHVTSGRDDQYSPQRNYSCEQKKNSYCKTPRRHPNKITEHEQAQVRCRRLSLTTDPERQEQPRCIGSDANITTPGA